MQEKKCNYLVRHAKGSSNSDQQISLFRHPKDAHEKDNDSMSLRRSCNVDHMAAALMTSYKIKCSAPLVSIPEIEPPPKGHEINLTMMRSLMGQKETKSKSCNMKLIIIFFLKQKKIIN